MKRQTKTQAKSKSRTAAKKITALAMMTAVSVVLGIICKNLFTVAVVYRFTLENLGVIMAGIFVGPVSGAAVGTAVDIISCLLSTNPAVNPVLTVGAACVGATAGIVFRALRPRIPGRGSYFIAAASAHLVGQIIIKQIAKMIMFGMPWFGVFIAAGFSAVAVAIEGSVITALAKNKQIMRFLGQDHELL